MSEMHLRKPGFTYSAWVLLTINKEKMQNLKKGDSRCIYQNKLHKACFQHDIDLLILKIYLEE